MLTEAAEASLARSVAFDEKILRTVSGIVEDVRKNGEEAVIRYVREFDSPDAKTVSLILQKSDFSSRAKFDDARVLKAILTAKSNIEKFHSLERERSFITATADVTLGQSVVPLDRVAVYVPGGKAFYPSTVLMTVIPAVIAGVLDITIVTPPDRNGAVREEICYLAQLLGVSRIVAAGGAQGIAYAAFGGKDLAPVDKIVGPGNVYVTLAKKLVYGYCAVDMLAGPSEIMIIADDSADPSYVARDLLSQAEHDEDAAAILVTTSRALINAVNEKLPGFIESSPRRAIAEASIRKNGKAILVDSLERAFAAANKFGPEHLEVITRLSDAEVIGSVKNAGALFLGEHTPEPLGDYLIGTNHVLPTYGASRFSSPLGVYDFYRRVNIIRAGKRYVAAAGEDVIALAEYEGLTAHADAVRERLR